MSRAAIIRLLVLAPLLPLASAFAPVMSTKPPKIVVCGGGVIGCSVAYHLSKRDTPVTLIDRSGGVAPAASGKAAGFLALDWNDGGTTGPLSRLSFKLHQELADTLGLDSYRRLSCSHVVLDTKALSAGDRMTFEGTEWVDCGVKKTSVMGTTETIAQVHPRQLTETMWKSAQDKGSILKAGRVERIEIEDRGGTPTVVGVTVDGEMIPCDSVVIAMGPWSAQAAEGLGLPPMYGQKYHSVLVQNHRELSQSVFFQGLDDPEVYPRPKGEVYITGFPDAPITVEEEPGHEQVRENVVDKLMGAMALVSKEVGEAPVTSTQACHLPITADGDPMIGKHPKVAGAFIAAGHGCWGILLAPATGLAMSELVLDGQASCIDLKPFDPERFYR